MALLVTSFTILFAELFFIRWMPAHVRFLSFFNNFLLMASFLGIGAGLLSRPERMRRLPAFPWLLAAVAVFVKLNVIDLRLASPELLYFGMNDHAARAENYVLLPVSFLLVAVCMAKLAAPLAPLLRSMPPLRAYALDIAGSLAGIAGFTLLAALSWPPPTWFAVLALALALAMPWPEYRRCLPALAITLVLVAVLAADHQWSPYYKLTLTPLSQGGYALEVNDIGHQAMTPWYTKGPWYSRPYNSFHNSHYDQVLIIGAGSGSDTSVALHHGVGHVDAVEIDPQILALGRALNPDHPYQDPRVSAFVNDGRAYLRSTDRRYDLIVFALPDSLTLTSSFSSLRLESFLFTQESFAAARQHLTKGGLLIIYNYYRQPWLEAKLAGMLQTAFDGQYPYITTFAGNGNAAAMMIGPKLADLDPAASAASAASSTRPGVVGVHFKGEVPVAATDNWPFLYLRHPTLPDIYTYSLVLVLLLGVGLLLALNPGLLSGASLRRPPLQPLHFFALGAAFLLLETRSLVTFALLFGTTWLVNALVFFAILLSVLGAILVLKRLRLRRIVPWYVALFGLLALNFLLPPSLLLELRDPVLRYLAAGLLAFSPVAVANVVFTHSFRDTMEADRAFAANLLGAFCGGLLEYLSLLTGYQALLLLVAAFYVAALAMRPAAGRGPATG